MKQALKSISILSAILIVSGTSALAQNSTRNIAPNNIAPQPGQNPSQCLAVTLAGSVYVRICNGGYTANGAGTQCGGEAFGGGGNFSLQAGGCGNGQQFLGGNLSCFGTQCNWTPSPAGFAAGFRSETVYAQYQ
jgi:hypothetical protein